MVHQGTSTNEWADRHRQALTTRHSHEDVLNDREFELLLEACGDLPAPRGFEAQFICLLGGRLGLRAGEIAHFESSWLDWNRKLIRIPQHEPCDCGYCQRQARQEVVHNDQLTEPMLSLHAGIQRPSRLLGQSHSISHCESNSVSSGSQTVTVTSHVHDQRLTDASKKPPTKRISLDEFIHTVCGQPQPAIMRTREWPRYRYKH